MADASMGTLAETIAADTEAYRVCQARHQAAVEAYEGARGIVSGDDRQSAPK